MSNDLWAELAHLALDRKRFTFLDSFLHKLLTIDFAVYKVIAVNCFAKFFMHFVLYSSTFFMARNFSL